MRSTQLGFAYLFTALLGMYLFSAYVQSLTLLCGDVSWEVHEVRRLLMGNIGVDGLFELTPPFFLFWYVPPVVLTTVFSMTIVHAVRLYIFILISISLAVCYSLVRKIFSKDIFLNRLFFLTIAAALLLLPMSADVGQREHLLLCLTMPYILLVAYRAQGGSVHLFFAMLIGIFAGLGFGIKPFFVMVPVLIEFYFVYHKRSMFAWVRAETLCMFVVLLIYAIATRLYFPSYVLSVVPLMSRVYYGYSSSWRELLRPDVMFCFIILAFCFSQYRWSSYKSLCNILSFTMIGFLGSYFIQKTNWYYHVIPAYAMAVLLLVLLFSQFARQSSISKWSYLTVAFVCGLVCVFLVFMCSELWTILVLAPKLFFTFFAISCLILASFLQTKKWNTCLIILCFVLMSGFLMTSFMRNNGWTEHRFLFTSIFMMLSFGFLMSETMTSPWRSIFVIGSGVILMAFPFYSLYCHYVNGLIYKKMSDKIVLFMHENAKHKPVYFFSTMASYEFPAVDYAEVSPVSRYQMLLWVPGYLKKLNSNLDSENKYQLIKDHQYFVNTVADELNANRPWLVFVDVLKNKAYMNNISFDFLEDFSRNPKFINAWKMYQYLTTVQQDSVYQFDVYQRKS